jgi:TusE/DsrC/DsvC family sulfur relay protein
MPTKMIANKEVDVNDEGFFVDANQWTEEMAPLLAEEVGVPTPLTEQHWIVLHYMRSEYFENGTGPTVRKLGKASGVTTKELFKLFPKGPAKLAARCAGIPKPRGCI